MPRKPRITEVGFYHIISRGVERRNVFVDAQCFEKFLSILEEISHEYSVHIHAFCLMSNHYHILLETTKENLSDYVKRLNSSYATWFNKTYNRTGHLWQGRYLSYFIFDDLHFWTVCKYIERNPMAAKIVNDIKAYPYQSLFLRIHNDNPNASIIKYSKISNMDLNEYLSFLSTELSSELKKSIYQVHKVNSQAHDKRYLSKSLNSFFEKELNRNEAIKEAYSYGYTQSAISKYLDISKMTVSKILKK